MAQQKRYTKSVYSVVDDDTHDLLKEYSTLIGKPMYTACGKALETGVLQELSSLKSNKPEVALSMFAIQQKRIRDAKDKLALHIDLMRDAPIEFENICLMNGFTPDQIVQWVEFKEESNKKKPKKVSKMRLCQEFLVGVLSDSEPRSSNSLYELCSLRGIGGSTVAKALPTIGASFRDSDGCYYWKIDWELTRGVPV